MPSQREPRDRAGHCLLFQEGAEEGVEEGTGAQRAIVAGGLPEGGGFTAGEAGEAIAPGDRV